MLGIMDAHEIEAGWISSLSSLVGDPREGNRRLYEFVRQAPDRLIPFYSFSPHGTISEGKDEINRIHEQYGGCAIKLHPWLTGFSVSTNTMYELSGYCAQLGLPILFHDGTPPYCDPLQLASLVELHPELILILGHAGLGIAYYDALTAALKHPTVYLCLCGTPLGDIRKFAEKVSTEKLFFGSDFYGIAEFSSYLDNMIDAVKFAGLSPELSEAILYKNAKTFQKSVLKK